MKAIHDKLVVLQIILINAATFIVSVCSEQNNVKFTLKIHAQYKNGTFLEEFFSCEIQITVVQETDF